MAKSVLKASEEVLNLLNTAAAIEDDGVTLGKTLSRDEYQRVNKFLETAGAKWDRKAGRHLFVSPDAKAKLIDLLTTGEIRDDKKHFQAFYTPAAVARRVVELADIFDGAECLEPSAGEGVLIQALIDAGAGLVYACELNPSSCAELRRRGLVALNADFLSMKVLAEGAEDGERADGFEPVDRIVMNPPFTGDQDIKHVLHAFGFLRPGGRLVAIMSPGFTFGETRIRREFREFVEEHGRVVEELPAGTFGESGTEVRTVIVELVK